MSEETTEPTAEPNATAAEPTEATLPEVTITNVDRCDRCACDDCPGIDGDTTAELAQHSKACAEKHF